MLSNKRHNKQAVVLEEQARIIQVIINFLALISLIMIVMAACDFAGIIDMDNFPLNIINQVICGIFLIDYLSRMVISQDKRDFFVNNVWDLIVCIPYQLDSLIDPTNHFAFIWLGFKLIMIIAYTEKFKKLTHATFHFYGFLHILYISTVIVIICSALYSITEKTNLGESIWWAIVTVATVGYGDVSPHTVMGKVAAVFLMLIGIGVVGLLTSTVTSNLIGSGKKSSLKNVKKRIGELDEKMDNIDEKLDKITELLDESNKKNGGGL